MKLIYIVNARIPTEKAHGIQIMKMCEAFVDSGAEVELVVPWRFNPIKSDPFEYYDVKRVFKIVKIPSLDLTAFGKIGFLIQAFSFAEFATWYILFKQSDIIYSRDEFSLFFLSFFKKNLFWEMHIGSFNRIIKHILKKCKGVIVITQGLKNFYKERSAEEEKIMVAPDSVDMEKFDVEIEKSEAREALRLRKDKNLIIYTGHLYDWKGAGILIDTIQFLSNDEIIVFVGGTENDVQRFREKNKEKKNVIIVGQRPHSEIPYYLKAADVLILPNTSGSDISEKYTSPMKLFEYMASKRPIVASDLPSIREILNEENAFLVEPNNPEELAEGIKKALYDKKLAERISKQAFLDVQGRTWKRRAENILEFIKIQ